MIIRGTNQDPHRDYSSPHNVYTPAAHSVRDARLGETILGEQRYCWASWCVTQGQKCGSPNKEPRRGDPKGQTPLAKPIEWLSAATVFGPLEVIHARQSLWEKKSQKNEEHGMEQLPPVLAVRQHVRTHARTRELPRVAARHAITTTDTRTWSRLPPTSAGRRQNGYESSQVGSAKQKNCLPELCGMRNDATYASFP